MKACGWLPRKREQAGRVETIIEFHLAPLQIEADGQVVLANHPTDGIVADEVIPREAGKRIVAEAEEAADIDRLDVIGRRLIGNSHAEGTHAWNTGSGPALRRVTQKANPKFVQ